MLVLLRELCPVPLIMTRLSEVEAKKVLSDSATLSALSRHCPPALPPVEGISTVSARLSVRLEKFTLRDAEPSVPAVLLWLVAGDSAVLPQTVE